jgi:hypothetical protein
MPSADEQKLPEIQGLPPVIYEERASVWLRVFLLAIAAAMFIAAAALSSLLLQVGVSTPGGVAGAAGALIGTLLFVALGGFVAHTALLAPGRRLFIDGQSRDLIYSVSCWRRPLRESRYPSGEIAAVRVVVLEHEGALPDYCAQLLVRNTGERIEWGCWQRREEAERFAAELREALWAGQTGDFRV